MCETESKFWGNCLSVFVYSKYLFCENNCSGVGTAGSVILKWPNHQDNSGSGWNIKSSVRPLSDRMCFLQWDGPFLNCFLLAVSILRMFVRLGHLLHLAFFKECSERTKYKKIQLWAEKHPTSFTFFSIV